MVLWTTGRNRKLNTFKQYTLQYKDRHWQNFWPLCFCWSSIAGYYKINNPFTFMKITLKFGSFVLKIKCLPVIELLVFSRRKAEEKTLNIAKTAYIMNILMRLDILKNDIKYVNIIIVWISQHMNKNMWSGNKKV